MFDYIAAAGIGTLIFVLFMLVFLRRDSRGQRGGRLGGCQHHHSDQGCGRCRQTGPVEIFSHVPDDREEAGER